jgi:hypothetical protein
MSTASSSPLVNQSTVLSSSAQTLANLTSNSTANSTTPCYIEKEDGLFDSPGSGTIFGGIILGIVFFFILAGLFYWLYETAQKHLEQEEKKRSSGTEKARGAQTQKK